ncbi:MAG: antA/AntB antirepressor family protein [Sulfuriferula sp.]
MNDQLIPTIQGQLAGETQQLVNARDLHAMLDVGKDFSTWIKDRIEQYGFTEGEEFSLVVGKTSSLFGGRPKIDYQLSIDMAKELALLEGNDKGRQARRYFIQMEKVARQEIPAFLRRGDLPRPGQVEALQIERLKEALLTAKPEWKALARYHAMGLSMTEMGKLLGKTGDAVRHHLVRMNEAGIITYAPNPQYSEAGRKGRAALTLKGCVQ